jgi:radical SAM superfamily enzyme YgiQ (UPF0313 family)
MRHSKRVALVLPPIEWPKQAAAPGQSVKNHGTPPLGLGQIGTFLASQGHVVRIFDAHRYGIGLGALARKLRDYDFIGISTVTSTISATSRLIGEIRRGVRKGGKYAMIIVGGHAPTLIEAASLADYQISPDFTVVGPGEQVFADVVRHAGNEEALNCHVVSGALRNGQPTTGGSTLGLSCGGGI